MDSVDPVFVATADLPGTVRALLVDSSASSSPPARVIVFFPGFMVSS